MTAGEPHTIGEWYVAFFDGPARYWWTPLCRPGFRHVCAFAYDAEHAVWLLYDVTMTRTHIRAQSSEQMDAWCARLPANRTIVRFASPPEPEPPAFRLGFWCAPAVAHLVGVASRALRPEALYRDLVAQGALPAFESETA